MRASVVLILMIAACASFPKPTPRGAHYGGIASTESIRVVGLYRAVDFSIYSLVDVDDGFERGMAYVGFHPDVDGEPLGSEACAPFTLDWYARDGRLEALLRREPDPGLQVHIIPNVGLSQAETTRLFATIRSGTRGRCQGRPPPRNDRALFASPDQRASPMRARTCRG